MRPKRNKLSSSDNGDTRPPFAGAMQQRLDRAQAFDLREHWWRFVDTWEERRGLRLACYGAATLFLSALVAGSWALKTDGSRLCRFRQDDVARSDESLAGRGLSQGAGSRRLRC